MSIAIGKRAYNQTDISLPSISNITKRQKFNTIPSCQDSITLYFDNPLQKLKIIFPDMEEKLLNDVLKDCDNNVQKAIESLNMLSISEGTTEMLQDDQEEAFTQIDRIDTTTLKVDAPLETRVHYKPKIKSAQKPQPQNGELNTPKDFACALIKHLKQIGSEEEAKNMAQMAFEAFEARIVDKEEKMAPENLELKDNLKRLIKDNSILKKAVLIQNEKCQNAMRLEHENSELHMHLRNMEESLKREKIANMQLQMYLMGNSCRKDDFFPGDGNQDVF